MSRAAGRFVPVLALSLALGGCASSGGGGGSGGLRAPITSEDLTPGRFSSLQQAIQQLRPTWLNRLGGIFVEGHQVSFQDLSLEPIAAIAEVRLISCERAMTRYPVSCITQRYLEVERKR